MILGRPTQLWLGAAATIWGLIVAIGHIDPTIAGLGGAAIGSVILLIANQPPTLAVGDQYNIQTPPGTPNYEATVARPPAPTKPVVADDPK